MDYIILVVSFLFDHVPAICNVIQEIIELFRLYSELMKKKELECENLSRKKKLFRRRPKKFLTKTEHFESTERVP